MIIGKKPSARTFADHAGGNTMTQIAGIDNDVLDFPVCERCERLALNDKLGRYTCPTCGHSGTVKVRVRDYLVIEKYIPKAARNAVEFADLKRQ